MNISNERISMVFHALSNPMRLLIVRGLLEQGECNVNKIVKALNIPQSTVSQHLGVLRGSAIIKGERRGVKVCYTIIDPLVKKILRLI